MMVKRGKKKVKTGKETKVKPTKQDLLLDNFVLLQKTLVETAAALKEVNTKITNMLELFEEASRTFQSGKKPSTNVLDKLDSIEEQNQVIAKTLLLLQKQLKEKEKYGITKAGLEPSIITKKKKKSRKSKRKEKEEPLFPEEFDEGEGEEEESETENEEEESDDYKPKPLPEFNF